MNSYFEQVVVSDYYKHIKVRNEKDKKLGKYFNIMGKVPYPLKRYYNSIIPLDIYQTWHTKSLPPLMQENVNKIILNNPAFKHHLFDDDDCRNFIKNNFNSDVLNAFDSLIPGAYKADLWRYCILYKKGGIYLDIKYKVVNAFKFINLTESEHFVLDIDKDSVYNALIVCLPGNNFLLNAINRVIENVRNKFYGINSLHPTGPRLLGDIIPKNVKSKLDMSHEYYKSLENKFIFFKGYVVLMGYSGYYSEQSTNQKTGHYSSYWGSRKIYKN